jgi:hypothetical protein
MAMTTMMQINADEEHGGATRLPPFSTFTSRSSVIGETKRSEQNRQNSGVEACGGGRSMIDL